MTESIQRKGLAMYIPPSDPGNLHYWNEEAKYRREMAGKGGLPIALIRLLW